MLKLIQKDFLVQKKVFTFFTIFLAAFTLYIFFLGGQLSEKEFVFLPVLFALCYNFANRSLYEDEKNNAVRMLVSLPIKRDTVVYSKYVSILLATLLMSGFYAVITAAVTLVDGSNAISLYLVAGFFLMTILIFSFYLPIVYKIGYGKAAWGVSVVVIGLGFALVGGIAGGIHKSASLDDKAAMLNLLTDMSSITGFSIAFVAVAAVFIASMRLSVAFFRKRNLF